MQALVRPVSRETFRALLAVCKTLAFAALLQKTAARVLWRDLDAGNLLPATNCCRARRWFQSVKSISASPGPASSLAAIHATQSAYC